MASSSEHKSFGPGDVTALPSGHDAWVVGNEPVVVIDWSGASDYGKAR
jgi:hypothetical protein